jgi:predicted transposase YbfD/YdcC
MEEFRAVFEDLTDPRDTNARHDLHEILLIALPCCAVARTAPTWPCSAGPRSRSCASSCGCVTASRAHRSRCDRSFSRVFRLLDPAQFHACFVAFMRRFAAIVRGHWGIENGLHWVLDVTMNEDHKRNRKDHGAENLTLLHRLVLNLAKLEPNKGSMKGKLKRAGWDNQFLATMLAQFASSQMR